MRVWIRHGDDGLTALTGAVLACNLLAGAKLSSCISDAALSSTDGYLRDYQISAATAALRAPMGRGILSLPMGSGKSRIALAIIAASPPGARWLYLAPNQQLITQVAEREMHPPGGRLDDHIVSYSTYGMVSSIELSLCDGIIADEVHRGAANTHSRAIVNSRALWRIGLSGTPTERMDARNSLVIGLLGPILCSVGIPELVSAGRLPLLVVRNVRV
jgi:superfamily II DNA or RNA helicase